jgi:gamma-glutamylcyclotransferase (GGCT)/AIG2-like uncharacterized protein YtfP
VSADRVLLFVYGLELEGERDHDLLGGSELVGVLRTLPRYTLVDLGVYPSLIEGGTCSVVGELYRADKQVRFALDVKKECPVLFRRGNVELEGGVSAEAYFMREEQVRGKRRLKQGSWKERFAPRPRADVGGPIVSYARKRFLR